MNNSIISASSLVTDSTDRQGRWNWLVVAVSAGLQDHRGGERRCSDRLVRLLSIIRHADYYSAALHVRCIARKFRTGQSLEWHVAGLRRALNA